MQNEHQKSNEAGQSAGLSVAQGSAVWEPIATAPTSQLVDIWTVGFGEYPHRVCDCYKDPVRDEWRTSRPMGQLYVVPGRCVTHWMRCPSPPPSPAELAADEAIKRGDRTLAELAEHEAKIRAMKAGQKYRLERTDGRPIPETAQFFVLRIDKHGKPETNAARAAVLFYAHRVRAVDPMAADAAESILQPNNKISNAPSSAKGTK